MDYFDELLKKSRTYLVLALAVTSVAALAAWAVALAFGISQLLAGAGALVIALVLSFFLADILARFILSPFKLVRQAVLHVAPEHSHAPAPNLETVKFGRELVSNLSLQIYQLASLNKEPAPAKPGTLDNRAKTIISTLPVPLFVMDKKQSIIFANDAAHKYLNIKSPELIGQNIYSVLDISFPTDDTFDAWLAESKQGAATASKSWEHARAKLAGTNELRQFDIAAYYSRDNPNGIETVIAIFDKSSSYGKDDEGVSYVALAVHELRTPLTLLRGYIEVFEDELDGKLTDELAGFMKKMQAAAQQLTSFVNNILNVARVEADQMVLQLHEDNWGNIVSNVVNDMNLRAQIHNKSIKFSVANNLPTVGVDRVSVYEVLANLLDNAIKYSGENQSIVVNSVLTKDGLIETTVQDWGVGIPEAVMPNLFEKFYRNHRTQSQVGGTGLGLYLCKRIIEAHGGNIWIRSKEGEGTTIGFTLQPYVMVAHKLKSGDNNEQGIVRSAHGWIKNHSLYRR